MIELFIATILVVGFAFVLYMLEKIYDELKSKH